METQDILKQLDRIADFQTLPEIAMEVNELLQDKDLTIKKLSVTIEKDQAIVSRILKLVNSAFFGFRSRIGNMAHAITLLGFNTIRNAVMSVSVTKAFFGRETFHGFKIQEFWRHSVAAAITSSYLAEKTHLQSRDNCFVGGLLHDIGKVVLSQYFTDLFKQILTSAYKNNLSFYEAERKEISTDHAQIGGYLAERWQLPGGLVDAIRYHHTVSEEARDINLLMIVHAANIIVNSYAENPNGEPGLSAIYPKAKKSMASQLETISEWFPQIEAEIVSACQFFLYGGS